MMSRRNTDKVKEGRSRHVPDKRKSGREDLRAEIAYRAARLIAEDGVNDFDVAKKKAARQLGVSAGTLLPDDLAVHTALKSHQAIFQQDFQPAECHALRKIAVEVMRWLHHFSPWLVGAVLDGSANHFSHVELEIVSDNAKLLEIFFLNEGTPFDIQIRRDGLRHATATKRDICLYEVRFRDFPVDVTLYRDHATRGGKMHARAQLATVELLLAADFTAP